MSNSTSIQWTDVTDNIIVVKGGGWWCRKISPGCANCYAATLNQNAFYGGNKLAYSGAVPELVLKRDILDGWARMRKSKKHFVASMTDVFGDWVDIEWQFEFLDAMAAAKEQTFQVLTKRAEQMRDVVASWLLKREFRHVPSNIWLGVSVENNATRTRIGNLKSIPCVRFLSLEPLLEDLSSLDLSEIQWVIVGGESGPKARPCDVEWIRNIVKECQAQDVACFVKQLGSRIAGNANEFYIYQAHYPGGNRFTTPIIGGNAGKCSAGYESFTLNDKKGGTMSSWPIDLRVREFPKFNHEDTKAPSE